MPMCYKELCEKDVICAEDLRIVGRVCDMELDERKGIIISIRVRPRRHLCPFLFGEGDIRIPFCHIRKIGPDIILVDL